MEPFGTLPSAKSRHYVHLVFTWLCIYIHGNTGALAYFDSVLALI